MVFVFACTQKAPEHHKQTFFRVDTAIDVTIVQVGKKGLKAIWSRIDSLLADWEKRYSQTAPQSEVAALNRLAGKQVTTGAVLFEMVSTAIRYADSLDGAFDPTILPLKELWSLGEGATQFRLPSSSQVDEALKKVDYKKIALDEKRKTVQYLSPDVRVDVGGIAKGYVLVEIGKILDAHRISDYLVVAGGDIICKGARKDGQSWRIGIQHPRKSGDLLGDFRMTHGSVATSGDYERYHIYEGIRYHHLFSTKTGHPCSSNRSFTLWGPEPVEVDILATGLFCRAAPDILAYLDARPRLAGLVVDSTGHIHVSKAWKSHVTLYK